MNILCRHKHKTGTWHDSFVLSCGHYVLLSYVIQEYGQEEIFRLRPTIGTTVHIARSPTAPWHNENFLLFTRAPNEHPMLHDFYIFV